MGERLTEPTSPRQAGEPVPSRPHTELRRVTIHEHDDRLSVMRLRGIGFSWKCTCGERGRIYGGRDLALRAKRQHEATHGVRCFPA